MCILKYSTYTIFLIQKCSCIVNVLVLISVFNLLCQWVLCIFQLNVKVFFPNNFFHFLHGKLWSVENLLVCSSAFGFQRSPMIWTDTRILSYLGFGNGSEVRCPCLFTSLPQILWFSSSSSWWKRCLKNSHVMGWICIIISP